MGALGKLSAWTQRKLRRAARYRAVFEGAEARWVLGDILYEGMVGQNIRVPGDPYETYFRLGMQHMAQKIAAQAGMTEGEILAEARQRGYEALEESTHDQQESY